MKKNFNNEEFEAIIDGLKEEASIIRKVVRNEDTNCILRPVRNERLRTLEWVIEYLERAKEWNW